VLNFGRLLLMILDYCWILFLKNKFDLEIKIKNLLTESEIKVDFPSCNDSGVNRSINDNFDVKSFGVTFEFSGPRTPQRNEKVERKIQTFYVRIRSILNGTNLKDELRSDAL
jgi:hypothetical protein